MKSRYDSLKHHRRSTRLKGYDYTSAGAYFVTICIEGGRKVLSRLEGDKVVLRHAGKLVEYEWLLIEQRFVHIQIDEYVIIPDHLHAILWLTDQHSELREPLGQILGYWKHQTTCRINEWREQRWDNGRSPIWQRGFHDRIIRDERELNFIREYIRNNPKNALVGVASCRPRRLFMSARGPTNSNGEL